MIQQTIQEVKFEEIILSKKLRQARKNNKIRIWLEYLNMLEENQNFQLKNDTIKQLHSIFIFREDFWLREITRVLQSPSSLDAQSFEFAFMALEDGFYIRVATLIAQKLFETYSSQRLRLNFIIAKLEIIICQFDFFTKECSHFFDILIKIYSQTSDNKKIRETYQRQISMGFQDYDVAYANYLKWEKSQTEQQQLKMPLQFLRKGKIEWQSTLGSIQTQILALQQQQGSLISEQIKNNKKNLKHAIFYLQNRNSAKLDKQKYLKLLNLLPSNIQKLWYLRRLALSQAHQMVEHYFELLELSDIDEEEVIKVFKVSFHWQNGKHYESLFLEYLIRKINKHLTKAQDEDYNNSWGQNVELFRNQISEVISKQRRNAAEQKTFVLKYYNFWVQVQTELVKDVSTVQQIFQNFLSWQQSQSVYLKYAECMTKLGNVSKANFIFNKVLSAQNYSGEVLKEYQNFLKIYGTIEDIIKLKEKLKIAGKAKLVPQLNKQVEQKINQSNNKATYQIKSVNQKTSCKEEKQDQNHKILPASKTFTQRTFEVETNNKSQSQKVVLQPQNLKNESFKRSAPFDDQREQISNQNHKKKVHLDQQITLFSKHIQENWTESDIMLQIIYKSNVNEVRLVKKKQHHRFCYIDFDSRESAQKQLNQNKSSLNLAYSHPPSKSNNCTLFLCNLPIDATKNQIQDLIPQLCRKSIKEVRLHQKGNKKTAYVEFQNQQNKNEALSIIKKQKIQINHRAIIALSCQTGLKNKQKKHKTIFLKNLAFKCKEKDIKSFFQQKGFSSINQVHIPKDQQNGKSKGFAYVQFDQLEQVEKALTLGSGELWGRKFSILKSDREITLSEPQKNQLKPSKSSEKSKIQEKNKKSNNFFSNIFS